MSVLVRNLTTRHDMPLVDEAQADALAAGEGAVALFFPGNPQTNGESNDVAVILPELVAAFQGRFTAAVVAPDAEKALAARHGVFVMPNLVFLRRGQVLGTIPKIQDWNVYMTKISAILEG
ncbi:hydrogenase accessory protein [Telmatospirillum sp. J64-1]|uniref:hydrogenase accessory protein n=1 Tax=Telmatospirillum sp. J64-1 TaxID=2502183 RepID=UPI00115DC63F|nr:hydrogenase accessory protein [Telmatospirillum sp. J64-1]